MAAAACRRSWTPPAGARCRSTGPRTVVVVLGGSVPPDDLPRLCARLRAVLAGGRTDVVTCDVAAVVTPDVGTVDALARLQLTARQVGCGIRVVRASDDLVDLLDLVGLADVLTRAGLLGQRRGQVEQREQALGVEEGGHRDDPAS